MPTPATLEGRVLDALRRDGLTIACAESCTGGLLGARLTRPAGASATFLGSIVAYHDDVKAEMLRIDRAILANGGAVSSACARQMALQVREILGADVGVAITGWAGPHVPKGGELGRVHIAVAHWGGVEVHDLHFPDEREKVREGAVEEALRYVLEAAPRAAKGRA